MLAFLLLALLVLLALSAASGHVGAPTGSTEELATPNGARPLCSERELPPAVPRPTEQRLSFRVAGVSFPNADGSSRQRRIVDLHVGDRLHLRRDPANAYDANAVAVVDPQEGQIGFVPRSLAVSLSPRLRHGATARARVSQIVGGGLGQHHGCVVDLRITDTEGCAG